MSKIKHAKQSLQPDSTNANLVNASDWNAEHVYVEDLAALAIAVGVVTIDCKGGDFRTLALTANVTSILFTNLPAAGEGRSIVVRIQQDATGGRTMAFPSSFKPMGATDTVIGLAANAITLLTLLTFDQGTRWEYALASGGA